MATYADKDRPTNTQNKSMMGIVIGIVIAAVVVWAVYAYSNSTAQNSSSMEMGNNTDSEVYQPSIQRQVQPGESMNEPANMGTTTTPDADGTNGTGDSSASGMGSDSTTGTNGSSGSSTSPSGTGNP